MSKLNLLIDFNNLLMRSLMTPGTTFYNSRYDNDNDINDIIKKITIDICYNIRLFSPDKIFILCDAPNPWRKDLLPDGDDGYKANRKKDEEKDWDNLWKNIEEYQKVLFDKNIPISKISRTEADDLAALWKEKLFTINGESIVFVSSDKDWRQLVDFDTLRGCFCAIFNPTINNKGRKKVFITSETCYYLNNNVISENDKISQIFGEIDQLSSPKYRFKKSIQSDNKIDIEIVNPFEVLIHKIFEGDDGDNVPSYYDYYKTTKRGTISTGVTPSQVNKLCEKLAITSSSMLSERCDVIKNTLEDIMKMELPVNASDRLNRQRSLVELNTGLFPKNIVNEFDNSFINFYNTIPSINIKSVKWKDILLNSKFFTDNIDDKPIVNAVFSDFGTDDFDKYFKGLF